MAANRQKKIGLAKDREVNSFHKRREGFELGRATNEQI